MMNRSRRFTALASLLRHAFPEAQSNLQNTLITSESSCIVRGYSQIVNLRDWTATRSLPAAVITPPLASQHTSTLSPQPRQYTTTADQKALHEPGSTTTAASHQPGQRSEWNPITPSDSHQAIIDYLAARLKTPKPKAALILDKALTLGYKRVGEFSGSSNAFKKPLVDLSIEMDIKPILDYLESIQGVSLYRAIQNSPGLLARSGSIDQMHINAAWLESALDLSPGDLGRIINATAHIIVQDVRSNALPNIQLLRGLGLEIPEIRKIVVKFSRVLVYKQQKLDFMVSVLKDLGMRNDQIKSAVFKHPMILGLTPERVRAPLLWAESKGLLKEDFPNLLSRFPAFVSYHIQENFDPKIEFFKTELGFTEQDVAKLLSWAPDLLGRSIDLLKMHIQYMRDLGLTDDQIKQYCQAYPGVLRQNLSTARYQLKLKFLQDELRIQDIGPFLVGNPFYLSYGIERIALRTAYLKSLGKSLTSVSAWLSASEPRFISEYSHTTEQEWCSFAAQWRQTDAAKPWLVIT